MFRLLISLSFLFFLLLASSLTYGQKFKNLVWSDEFNYSGLPDSTKWNYEEGMKRNHEAQYYTRQDIDNASVKNGNLVIEARKEKMGNASITSASLITRGKKSFLYGRIEVRAKLPMARGTWPAIWMLGEAKIGWPARGEIDIMENVGYDSLKIHGNIHTEKYNHVLKTNKGKAIDTEGPWRDFHVYAIEWTENKIDFFYDDLLYFTFEKEANTTNAEWPYDKPHYLILNLAIGGDWGGQKGIDDSKFPHLFYIDYVRVYQ